MKPDRIHPRPPPPSAAGSRSSKRKTRRNLTYPLGRPGRTAPKSALAGKADTPPSRARWQPYGLTRTGAGGRAAAIIGALPKRACGGLTSKDALRRRPTRPGAPRRYGPTKKIVAAAPKAEFSGGDAMP